MRVSEVIVPIAECKTKASQLIREMGQTHRTVIVTHNGHAAAVVMPPEDYDRLNEHDDLEGVGQTLVINGGVAPPRSNPTAGQATSTSTSRPIERTAGASIRS